MHMYTCCTVVGALLLEHLKWRLLHDAEQTRQLTFEPLARLQEDASLHNRCCNITPFTERYVHTSLTAPTTAARGLCQATIQPLAIFSTTGYPCWKAAAHPEEYTMHMLRCHILRNCHTHHRFTTGSKHQCNGSQHSAIKHPCL